MQTEIQEIIEIVTSLNGHQDLYFNEDVRNRGGYPSFSLWAINVSKRKRIAVMNEEGQWYEVVESDLIVPTLLKKLREIKQARSNL